MQEPFSQQPTAIPLPDGVRLRPPVVLVVDDDEGICHLYERLLSARGYAVVTARNGVQALQAVREQPPDVVLLDVAMPGLNGFEVCRQLKRDRATRLTPELIERYTAQGFWRSDTIYALARTHAERAPDSFAVRDRFRRVTYRRLVDAADTLAADLARLLGAEGLAPWP